MNPNLWKSGASATPPDAPTSPSVGYPTGGDPALGIEPTTGGAYWFYQLSQEIQALLVAAGITPDHEDLGQVLAALDIMYAPKGVGGVEFFATSTAPTGYLKANGALISRTTYAALFAAIGTTFGVGDGATTFALPDLRGEFIRGFDDTRGVDAGRVFGSAQSEAVSPHSHVITVPENGGFVQSAGSGAVGAIVSRTGIGDSSTANSSNWRAADIVVGGSTELRPRNIALLACIKF